MTSKSANLSSGEDVRKLKRELAKTLAGIWLVDFYIEIRRLPFPKELEDFFIKIAKAWFVAYAWFVVEMYFKEKGLEVGSDGCG